MRFAGLTVSPVRPAWRSSTCCRAGLRTSTPTSGPISDALPQLFQNDIYRNVAGPNGQAPAGAARLLVTAAGMHHPGRALQLMQYSTLLLPTALALHLALARIRPRLLTRRLRARPECRRNGRSCCAQPNATVRRAFLQAAG